MADIIRKPQAGTTGLDMLKRDLTVKKSHQESVVLCLDCSGSMYPHMAALREAASGFVNACVVGITHVGIIAFETRTKEMCPVTPNLTDAGGAARRLADGGSTKMGEGLRRSLLLLVGSQAGVMRVILMTDGLPDDKADAEAAVDQLVKTKVVLDTVAFGPMADRAWLKKIAKKTGGVMRSAGNAQELVHEFRKLEVHSRGLLGPVKP